MLTIISGTHRPNSYSLKTAEAYSHLLDSRGIDNQILDLQELPREFIWEMFSERSIEWKELIEKYIVSADKIILISPEYNGSYPGIVKVFFDAMDPSLMKGKWLALTGIASGRFGNQRGLDDLTMVLHHVKAHVIAQKVLIPAVYEHFDKDGSFVDAKLIERVEDQLDHLFA